jgi:histidinol-phosphate aminotransferase
MSAVRSIFRPALDKVAPYDAGRPLEALAADLGLPDLVRLSANENPLGTSPRVIEAIAREAARSHLYPDGGSTVLRTALAGQIGVSAEQIVVGNGADELIALLAWSILDPGDEVVIPHPSFEPYSSVSLLMGAVPRLSPLVDYAIDLDGCLQHVTDRTKAIFLCSPHNPASTIVRRTPLLKFLDALGTDPPLVVLDEAYRDFCDDPEYPDGSRLLARYPRLLVVRTFSKITGLAGLRVGYAIASAEVIERLNRVRPPYNVNRLAQAAAVAALGDREHTERTRRAVLVERAYLASELARRGYFSPPAQGNFLLARVGDEAATIRERALHAGVLVRDGAGLGFPGHLRISIGTREVNDRLLAAVDGTPAIMAARRRE